MNQAVVVDASVAVKWVLAEELTEQARALLRESVRRPILAPPHLTSEVTNALYQRVRTTDPTKHLSEADAQEALTHFLSFRIEFHAPAALYQQALIFAQTHHLSHTYDSLYVVLAQLTNTELWTGDKRLITAVGSVAPWVRFIGDYPLKE
jgi:predicted nucleic acid-binding protein